MDCIDLHLHSTCSDGTMSPSQLVHEAARRNIKAIAITDHDTIEGVEEALLEGKSCKVEILSGVEISAYLDDIPMHILGYGFRHTDAALQESLKKIQQARNDRNIAILKKLNDLGIDVTQDDLKKQSKTGQAGRPHIASLLVEKKIVHSMDEAFSRYLRKDGRAFAERKKLMAQDAIAMINEAGGIAALTV